MSLPTENPTQIEIARLLDERDAFKSAADRLLDERSQALEERDKLANELASERKTNAEQVRPPGRQRKSKRPAAEAPKKKTPLSVELLHAVEEHSRELRAITEQRDSAARQCEEVARELQQARESHARELEAAAQARAEILQARENLAQQLLQVREQARRELAQTQEAHDRDLGAFSAQREHYRKEIELLVAQRDEFFAGRQDLSARLDEQRLGGQEALDKLAAEAEQLRCYAEELYAEFDRTREEQSRTIEALALEKEKLSAESRNFTAELERVRSASADQLAALERDRDALLLDRKSLAADFTNLGDQQKHDLEEIVAHHDNLADDRNRLSGELARFQEMHAREMETLTRQRDGLLDARNELREHLDAVNGTHRAEVETLRQEYQAVLNEHREMLALLERDRLSSRKQVELFTEERDILVGERDAAVSELTHERQTLGRQVDLGRRESENLAAQRNALLRQLNHLREAQQQQHDLFGAERRILIAERDSLSAKLESTLKSLGMDRVTLLEQKLEAEARFAAAVNVHRREVEALQQARDAARQERAAVVAELEPLRAAQRREMAVLGTATASRYAAAEAGEHRPAGRRFVRDAVIERTVEMRVCPGGEAVGPESTALLEELRHLGRLQHPCIPPIYEAGLDENGRLFYTVRQVDGVSLGEVLRQLEDGRVSTLLHFTLKRLLGVFHKVCDAVAFAHSQGIAHGHLLADHVILGAFGDVLVTHWANRRLAGAVPPFDIASQDDIIALGRMLYEITTLEPPPDSSVVRPESAAPKKAPGSPPGGSPSHYWDNEAKLKTLVTLARRVLDPRARGHFHSVREFQIQVDAFKDSFDDPLRLNVRRLLWHWIRRHKVAAATLFLLVVLAAGALGMALGREYLAYRDRSSPTQPVPRRR